jgi:hypothetical protein
MQVGKKAIRTFWCEKGPIAKTKHAFVVIKEGTVEVKSPYAESQPTDYGNY